MGILSKAQAGNQVQRGHGRAVRIAGMAVSSEPDSLASAIL